MSSSFQHPSEHQWHQLSVSEVAKRLGIEIDTGLANEEISQRQERYGENALEEKAGKSPIVRFLMEFNQPLIYILLLAGVVALLLRDWVDAGVIFGVTLINAVEAILKRCEQALDDSGSTSTLKPRID